MSYVEKVSWGSKQNKEEMKKMRKPSTFLLERCIFRTPGLIRMAVEIVDAACGITNLQETTMKLFNHWSFDEVQISDISLEYYIAVNPAKHAAYVLHIVGYSVKRFRKSQCPIVERLTNSLMMDDHL